MRTSHLVHLGVKIIKGPHRRTGVIGPIIPLCVLDPDDNLIEISNDDNAALT